jgi:hypothetical protein
MTIRFFSDRVVNRIVSRVPGVRDAVKDQADRIGTQAEAGLAAHRKTGDTTVGVDHSGVDSVVYLDDTRGQAAALSIEFGTGDSEGLYVLHRAAGLL